MPQNVEEFNNETQEIKETLPSEKRKENFTKLKNNFFSTSSLIKSIRQRATVLPKSSKCSNIIIFFGCLNTINNLNQEMQRSCGDSSDGTKVTGYKCLAQSLQTGDLLFLISMVMLLFAFLYRKVKGDLIIIPRQSFIEQMLDKNEMASLNKIKDDSKYKSAFEVYNTLNEEKRFLKSMFSDRTAFLTFAKGKQIDKGASHTVSEFLGCQDLMDHPTLKPR